MFCCSSHLFEVCKKLWKEQIRLISVEDQPTKAVLAQTSMGVFFIPFVSETNFLMQALLVRFSAHVDT
jgi:hypothetical protein